MDLNIEIEFNSNRSDNLTTNLSSATTKGNCCHLQTSPVSKYTIGSGDHYFIKIYIISFSLCNVDIDFYHKIQVQLTAAVVTCDIQGIQGSHVSAKVTAR